jgi:GDPmannose 4,6-dehydratase
MCAPDDEVGGGVYHVTVKRALVTGITGQTGSYLAELLLEKGYEVHGIVRRSSSFNTERIDHIYKDPHDPEARLFLHYGDLLDASSLEEIVKAVLPHEIYNLGAQSHVRVSFDQPVYTANTVALGTLRLLEAARGLTSRRSVKFYQASSSEMFGASPAPQTVESAFRPRSPYGVGKVAAFHAAVNYREAYGMFVTNGILFNHESPRRGETFVTRKITRAVGRIRHGLQTALYLGNLDARRDWGHAKDYVRAIWMMMQHHEPRDWVVGTGKDRSVREFAEHAFGHAGFVAQEHIEHDPRYLRPTEVDELRADIVVTRDALGWEPSISFEAMIHEMVEHDMELARWERKKRDDA